MSESIDALLFDDPEFDVDPDCDAQPYLPEGSYSNAEYSCRVISLAPQRIGDTSFANLAVLIQHPEMGVVFARTQPWGASHTQLAKNSGSAWPQMAASLGIDPRRADNETVGEYWVRVGQQVKDMPVNVVVGLKQYVRKEDQLPKEALDAGEQPKQTYANFIRSVVAV